MKLPPPRLLLDYIVASAIVAGALGAAIGGLTIELLRRGVCRAWGRA